jgi:hypothetical protein
MGRSRRRARAGGGSGRGGGVGAEGGILRKKQKGGYSCKEAERGQGPGLISIYTTGGAGVGTDAGAE